MAERHLDDFRAHESLPLLEARTDSAAPVPANAVPKLDSPRGARARTQLWRCGRNHPHVVYTRECSLGLCSARHGLRAREHVNKNDGL